MNEAIVVDINLLELVNGAIAAAGVHRLFQTDQSIPVHVESEEIFHRMALDQMAVKSTIGFRDGQDQRPFPSSIRAEFLFICTF